jgi:trk system potassium uptake protein TrkA
VYVLIVGGGKVGSQLVRELSEKGHELTLIEENDRRYDSLSEEFEHVALNGDGSEIWVLERAGIQRADMVIAVTGDDEDNILISQMARERYGIERVIARCNNPRNLQHFELLGAKPAVSATDLILRLIEHEVPRYGTLHLLDLPQENLEIIELEISADSPAAGSRVADLGLPEGALVISILRNGDGFVPVGSSEIRAGDEILLALDAGLETTITERFVPSAGRAA